MKISELLTFKQTIDSWDVNGELKALDTKLTLIKESIPAVDASTIAGSTIELSESIDVAVRDCCDIVTNLAHLKKSVDVLCAAEFHTPLLESYAMYEERKDWVTEDWLQEVRDRDLFGNAAAEDADEFANIIKMYAKWQYPSAYIRPNTLRFFDSLKASGILYMMDQASVTKYLFRNSSKSEFGSVLFKSINENHNEFLDALPQNQVGLIVMEDFINFKPVEIIKQYLTESFDVLRPGGHILFTYNDCDHPSGARNFEEGMYCFTPGSMLREMAELIGYNITLSKTTNRVSWLCLEKPGELTTIKGGKALGEITKDKPAYDPTRSIIYNQRT